MEISAQAIADHLGGEVVGNPNVMVSSVAKIESGKPGTLCFLANPKYEHYLYTCKASIILINKSFEPKEQLSATLVKVDDAYAAMASLLELLNSMKKNRVRGRSWRASIAFSAKLAKGVGVAQFAYIGKRSTIGKNTQIYPHVYIGDDVVIGDNCIIYPGVKIYSGCKVGNRCIVHAGAVIGADGFGFAPLPDGSYKKIPQTGIVTIEDDVEIGANTTIDRGTMETTIVRKGTKLDNLIQIAHNVQIGENTVIAAQTGIAGSTIVGNNCVFGGQVGIAGHLKIADKTSFAAQAGLISNIKEPGKAYMGMPAIEYRTFMKAYATFKNNGQK